MIKPSGFGWGAEEYNKKRFLIIQTYLTEEEAEEFMQPEKRTIGIDRAGVPVVEILRRRMHSIDIDKQNLRRNLLDTQEMLKSKPLLPIEAFETKDDGEGE